MGRKTTCSYFSYHRGGIAVWNCFGCCVVFSEDYINLLKLFIEVYNDFFQHINDRIKEAEEAILKYYNSVVKERCEDGYYDQYIEITKSEELAERKQIALQSVVFGFYYKWKKTVRYGLVFDCEWNIDDGLGIRYDGTIAEIGTSDVVL